MLQFVLEFDVEFNVNYRSTEQKQFFSLMYCKHMLNCWFKNTVCWCKMILFHDTHPNRLSAFSPRQNWLRLICLSLMKSTCCKSNVLSRYLLSLTYPSPFTEGNKVYTTRSSQNWSWRGHWIWDERELTRLRDNHSRFAGSKATAVCFAGAPLLVVLSTTDTADVEACGKREIRYHNRIQSVSEEVTSSGIASSDRLRGQTRNPPSHSQRTKVRPQFARAAERAAGAWPRRPLPPCRCRWGWAPNPVCCGATGEGPAAVATRPGRLYSLAPAAGGGHSKGRAGRSAQSKIWSPSCCSSQQWSTPSDKTSYFAALWWQLLESRQRQ